MIRLPSFRLDSFDWKRQSLSNLDQLREAFSQSSIITPWTEPSEVDLTEPKADEKRVCNARELTSNFSVHKDLYEELYDEPKANLHRRQKAFYDAWRDFLASRRAFWKTNQGSRIGRTPAEPGPDPVRAQVTMQVRYDMAFDFPMDPEWPPLSDRWADEWRAEQSDLVMEQEVASRMKRLNRVSTTGNARYRGERSRKTQSMIA